MQLLFDENLAPRLVVAVADLFPGSAHVHNIGLSRATDDAVWIYARDNGFTLVSKDSDFHERSLLFGYPPKVVWIRRGNCSTAEIEGLLRANTSQIERLASDSAASLLILL